VPVIDVVACLLVGADGRALMVRKRGTSAFMQPGGKPEPGESGLDALRRELSEELGLELPADAFTWVGEFDEDAANEPGHRVHARVWRTDLHHEHVVAAEIEEARWVDPRDPGDLDLAPLSSEVLLPLLAGSQPG
jgi:8-oxo-dGTP pyrophosphatase MutT (NUDIX family)